MLNRRPQFRHSRRRRMASPSRAGRESSTFWSSWPQNGQRILFLRSNRPQDVVARSLYAHYWLWCVIFFCPQIADAFCTGFPSWLDVLGRVFHVWVGEVVNGWEQDSNEGAWWEPITIWRDLFRRRNPFRVVPMFVFLLPRVGNPGLYRRNPVGVFGQVELDVKRLA